MPSISLGVWQTERMRRLDAVDGQCATALAAAPPHPHLVEENLRGYVLLLSAHFQGFCRDLYSECAQQIVTRVRPRFQAIVQMQFSAHRKLNHGNPNHQNLRDDYERFRFSLDLAGADPANPVRLSHLAELNHWRNVAAHQGTVPAHLPPLSLSLIQGWRNSCAGLATSLDQIMYNQMRKVLRRAPW